MKTFLIALALTSAVVFISPAFASAATNAGVKPGNFWYKFDIAFEKINLFFTLNPESKARKALKYADERLAEAEAVAENNDTSAVKTAISNYESIIAFAVEKSKNVTAKEKAEALLSSIVANTSRHQKILAEVLAKVPDEAKEAITKAIEASRKGQEEIMQKIAELKGEIGQLKREVEEPKKRDEENQAAEIERLKKEVDELKKKPIPTSVVPEPTPTIPLPTTQPQTSAKEDSALKIARCEAETWKNIDQTINSALSEALPKFQKLVDDAQAQLVRTKQEQLDCTLYTPSELIGASPEQQQTARGACFRAKQPTVDYYANLVQQQIDLWEQAKRETRRLAEQQYNSLYLQCLTSIIRRLF